MERQSEDSAAIQVQYVGRDKSKKRTEPWGFEIIYPATYSYSLYFNFNSCFYFCFFCFSTDRANRANRTSLEIDKVPNLQIAKASATKYSNTRETEFARGAKASRQESSRTEERLRRGADQRTDLKLSLLHTHNGEAKT